MKCKISSKYTLILFSRFQRVAAREAIEYDPNRVRELLEEIATSSPLYFHSPAEADPSLFEIQVRSFTNLNFFMLLHLR